MAILGIIIIAGLFALISGQRGTDTIDEEPEVATEPFTNSGILDFYDAWIEARESLGDSGLPEELLSSPTLSPAMQLALREGNEAFKTSGVDPVLCSSFVPTKVKSRNVFATDSEAQVIMYLNIDGASSNALVNLAPMDGAWVITNIDCSSTEEAPDRGEFNFDREGNVLKQSLQTPFDSNRWHLIFEQNGTAGHIAPLFTDSAVCFQNGSDVACSDILYEPARVRVQGNMSEAGVDVVKIEVLE